MCKTICISTRISNIETFRLAFPISLSRLWIYMYEIKMIKNELSFKPKKQTNKVLFKDVFTYKQKISQSIY